MSDEPDVQENDDPLAGMMYSVGFSKKGNPIHVEIPKIDQQAIPIETGHISPDAVFQLFYIHTIQYEEVPQADLTTLMKPTGERYTPFIAYNYKGHHGVSPVNDNGTFIADGVEGEVTRFRVKTELEYYDGMQREVASNYLNNHGHTASNIDELYIEVRNYLSQYTWFENDIDYDIETLYVIGSYFHQAFKVYPIYALRGPVGCGKTRTNQVMCSLAYNSIFTPNLSDATFYYARASFHCTLGLDEKQIKSRKEENYLEDLINNSYKRGGCVLRLSDEKPRFIKKFPIFGPLIYSSTKEMPFATSTRSIEIMMQVTDKLNYSDLPEPERDEPISTALRDKLYLARLRFGSDVCSTYLGLSNKDYNVSNRDWELYKPFIALTKVFAPFKEDALVEMLKARVKEKEQDKAEEFEYQVLLSIKNVIDTDAETLDESQWALKDGNLYLGEFTQKVIELFSLDENYVSWRRVRKALKSLNLYLHPSRGKGNKARFFVDQDKVNDWIKRANLTESIIPPDVSVITQKHEEREEPKGIEKFGFE
jgi:hypothetical protein